jgi:hypothetical protein
MGVLLFVLTLGPSLKDRGKGIISWVGKGSKKAYDVVEDG